MILRERYISFCLLLNQEEILQIHGIQGILMLPMRMLWRDVKPFFSIWREIKFCTIKKVIIGESKDPNLYRNVSRKQVCRCEERGSMSFI